MIRYPIRVSGNREFSDIIVTFKTTKMHESRLMSSKNVGLYQQKWYTQPAYSHELTNTTKCTICNNMLYANCKYQFHRGYMVCPSTLTDDKPNHPMQWYVITDALCDGCSKKLQRVDSMYTRASPYVKKKLCPQININTADYESNNEDFKIILTGYHYIYDEQTRKNFSYFIKYMHKHPFALFIIDQIFIKDIVAFARFCYVQSWFLTKHRKQFKIKVI